MSRLPLVSAWGLPAGSSLAWVALQIGLGLFTFALFLLLVTQWGQSRPLRKCLLLSLWAHLLLAIYATTLSVFPGVGARSGDSLVQLSEIDGSPQQSDGIAEDAPSAPWEQPSTTVPELALPELPSLSPPPKPLEPDSPREPLPSISVPPAPPLASQALPPERAPKSAEPLDESAFADHESPPRAEMLPQIEPLADDAPTAAPSTAVAASTSATPAASGYQPPAALQLRVAPDRLTEAQRHGGSTATEGAVNAALAWLAIHQSPDGRWDASLHGAGRETFTLNQDRGGAGANADTGITGLALLAMLGAGQTHRSGEHAVVVARGLDFLLRSQRTDGALGGSAEPFAFMYCHGMATLALGEALAMSGDARLQTPLRRAIGYTLAAQHPTTGGWRYRPQDTGDMSQLGWQLMALRSAQLGGADIPSSATDGMIRFITSVGSGRHGGLGSYRPGERVTPTMTAEALACRQFLGMARENPASDEAGDYLLDELPSGQAPNFYYWYYGTLGMYQLQGAHWDRWNAALQRALVDTQRRDAEAAGSWDPDPQWGGYGGRVYSTALGALCLEVYYRYLPLYGETTARKQQPSPR